MDTAVREADVWTHRDPGNDEYHKAWIDGDELVGEGVVNDKGPMAAFLIAAKAVKAAGVALKGDLLVSAVVGETSHEPSDGPPGEIINRGPRRALPGHSWRHRRLRADRGRHRLQHRLGRGGARLVQDHLAVGGAGLLHALLARPDYPVREP